jgi:hypothetical protein
MTSSTPYDPAHPTEPVAWSGPTTGAPAPAPRGRGRTLALVGGLLGIVGAAALGGYAVQQLSGGGAQPESALPATTVAFVKVDLDPSAGQKLDAIRFLRKFPDAKAKVSEDADLRKVLFDAVKEDGGLEGVDYAKDVEPWLGQRAAFGLVPRPGAAKPVTVLALAVEDRDAAAKSLPRLSAAADAACQVVDDFALCAEDKDQLAGVVAGVDKGTLAEADSFATDMADLGEDGVVAAWADLPKAAALAKDLGTGTGFLGGLEANPRVEDVAGRLSMALRFDGPHLELAGHVSDVKTELVGTVTAKALADLPDSTLAAVTVANAGDQLKAAWPELEKTLAGSGDGSGPDMLGELEQQLGLSLPDDLVKALGSQLTIAFGGLGTDTDEIKLALATDGDKAAMRKVADAVGQGMGAGEVAFKGGDRRTVLGLSDDWADAVAAGGSLGGTARFKDAVHGLDSARVAAYVDVAGLVEAFGDDMDADERKNLTALGSVGLTASGGDGAADFALRLTTR